MCGIFGYIGEKEAIPFILEGLKKLEYRGYDSAGVATLEKGQLFVTKCLGKIQQLEEELSQKPIGGQIGVGHTRWATHGKPSQPNSHPHQDCTGKIAVVHNGIIENYLELRRELANKGHHFSSTTDTEVIAHLIEENYDGDLLQALAKSLKQARGAYALAIISEHTPNSIIIARQGSPLIVGFGAEESFISSDIAAMLKYTNKIIQLENGQIGRLTPKTFKLFDLELTPIKKRKELVSWDPNQQKKAALPILCSRKSTNNPVLFATPLKAGLRPKTILSILTSST